MKIVHFAKFYPPEYGGIESVTEALAEDHAAAGHNVEVVCFTRGASSEDEQGRLTLRRVKVQTERASQPLAASYLRICVRAARMADVVHVHTPNMLAALAVLLLPRFARIVIHWHADIEDKGVIGQMVRPIERAMLRRANVVVATTEAYAEASEVLAPFSDRVRVIPIGIADVDTKPKFETVSPPYVIFIGRLVPYKGLGVLLDAIASVQSDAEFRIIGIGPQESWLREKALRLGIEDRVMFMGRVEEHRLQNLLAGAAVFCLPSINRLEAFGVVLLEAMRAGRALVATDIPGSGVPWVNSTGINVPVGNPQALAEALDNLLAHPGEAARLGKLARARFEREFSRDVMSARFLELYEQLVENDNKCE
ncbi:glycosyltransferase [Sulfitobacter sp. 1A13496]|uniref:glycosyltransferase n=1 Tax=Sulfitobacter sp. 1A13496 TaxID=3368596 RepID=UPI003744E5EC